MNTEKRFKGKNVMSAQTDILQSTAPLHKGWVSDCNLHEIQPLEGNQHQTPALGMNSSATCSPTCFISPPLVTAMATLHCGAGDPK